MVALILLVTCVLKQPLPDSGFLVDNPDWEESEDEDEDVSQEEQEGGSEQQEGAGAEKQWRGSSSGGGSDGELARDSGSTSTAAAKDVELGAVQVCGVSRSTMLFYVRCRVQQLGYSASSGICHM